jgi:APA family basic amino acid/polyamine antiporter
MAIVMALYLAVNLAYHYALPVAEMPKVERVGEAAVAGVLGPRVATVMSAVILVSILGSLNGAILSGARIPYAAAVDRLGPSALARVHPRYHTPAVSLATQGVLACALIGVFTLLGIANFEAITDMVIFASWAFYGMCCAAVIVLRRRHPELPRAYRAWGYPYAQALFVLASAWLFVNSIVEAPSTSAVGLGLIALGVPVYFALRPADRETA